MKRTYKHMASNEKEMQHLIKLAKQKGLKRTQNCYWIENWENKNELHIFERNF